MGTSFAPTPADVERYRRLRALSTELNHRIIKTIPRQTFYDVGEAIGVLHRGVLEFDSEDMTSVLMDCCLYDWLEEGKNVVQRYSETHPAKPGTDERYLLDAYLQAKYRMLVVQSAVPGAGIHCRDLLHNEELFVMDVGLSQTAKNPGATLATRTIPLGEYWMTGGAGLPITSKTAAQEVLRRIKSRKLQLVAARGSLPLLIVRTCLAAGAADHVTYEDAGMKTGQPYRRSRWPWS